MNNHETENQKKLNNMLSNACKNSNLSINFIKTLIEKKANINTQDYNNNTILQIACMINTEKANELIKVLIENKAEFSIKNNQKFLPIHNALLNENINEETIKLLLEKCENRLRNKFSVNSINHHCYL